MKVMKKKGKKVSREELLEMIAKDQDVANVDTSEITDMSDMFWGAKEFNQDISNWDVGEVTDMNGMFRGASSFNQDISKWNISKVTYMYEMFNRTDALKEQPSWYSDRVS